MSGTAQFLLGVIAVVWVASTAGVLLWARRENMPTSLRGSFVLALISLASSSVSFVLQANS